MRKRGRITVFNFFLDKKKLNTVMRQGLLEDHPAKRTQKRNAKKKAKYIRYISLSDIFDFLQIYSLLCLAGAHFFGLASNFLHAPSLAVK